ncbi:hypothetical protein NQ318_012099, partial [Aromia moschata]
KTRSHKLAGRATSFNKTNVGMFFDKLGVMDKYRICSSRIWNTEKTGVSTVCQSLRKVLLPRENGTLNQLSENVRSSGMYWRRKCEWFGLLIKSSMILCYTCSACKTYQ